MVIAEELGLEYKDIRIDLDSHEIYRPYGGGSDGSTASSWAMKECANILKQRILEAVIQEANNPPAAGGIGMRGGSSAKQAPNPFKGLKPEDLDTQSGKVVVKDDPSKGLPLTQAVRSNLFATYSGRPPLALWNQRGRALDTMNVAACEVAVDPETGEVEIIRFGVVVVSREDHAMDFAQKPDRPGNEFQRRMPASGGVYLRPEDRSETQCEYV